MTIVALIVLTIAVVAVALVVWRLHGWVVSLEEETRSVRSQVDDLRSAAVRLAVTVDGVKDDLALEALARRQVGEKETLERQRGDQAVRDVVAAQGRRLKEHIQAGS